MAVLRQSVPAFLNCLPQCEPAYRRLVKMLKYSLDAMGNLYPPNLDLGASLLKVPVAYTRNNRYNFDLVFQCQATLSIDKPSIHWIMGHLHCQSGMRIGEGERTERVVAMLTEPPTVGNDNNDEMPPVHPGEFLKVWLMEKPRERIEEVLRETELSRDQLEGITNCELPVNERAAMELTKIFGAEAELWFRMQFAFDYFQQTGHEPEIAELPELMRRVPEMV